MMSQESGSIYAASATKRWLGIALILALLLLIATFAALQIYSSQSVTKPYAPYTAGPVVQDEPYAPYTAGPVVREVPRAAYTPGEEVPYAPYTAGPVVGEEAQEPYAPYPLPR